MENLLRKKILNHEKAIGTFFEGGNAIAAEALAISRIDFMIVDTEHGPLDVESVMHVLRSAELHDTTALVRVKDPTRNSILKMLDIGAAGLIIPMIKSIDEIRKIVEYGKYFPVGQRGVCFTRASGFGYYDYCQGDIKDYFAHCNRETLLIPQCETVECLENIEEIAAVEGIDGIFIGPADLSTAMGIPMEFDRPAFKAAIERIIRATKEAGKFIMMAAGDASMAKIRFDQGIDCVAVGGDINFYVDAVNAMVDQIRN